jgi:hypothetical protein
MNEATDGIMFKLMRRLVRALSVLKTPARQIIVGGASSIALSLVSVWLYGAITADSSRWILFLAISSMLLSYVVPSAIVVLILYRSFQRRMSPKAQIQVIVSSYFCMIVIFTGVFFSMTFYGDHEYAIDHYFYYKAGGEDLVSGRIQRLNPYPDAVFAFTGIKERLWGTVDDYLPRGIYRRLDDLEAYRGWWAARAGFTDIVRFKRRAVTPVLSDCFHLSVITITTVGYGNIAPNTWYAKLATDVEALSGTVLLVVAFGMLLAGFRERAAE